MNIWKYVKSTIFIGVAVICGLLLFAAMRELFLTGTFTVQPRSKPEDALGVGLLLSGIFAYAMISAIEDALGEGEGS